MKARQVQFRLYELGFLLGKFKNPNASVHTAINRMLDSGELTLITGPTDGTKYFESGPSLKPTPGSHLSKEKKDELIGMFKQYADALRVALRRRETAVARERAAILLLGVDSISVIT